MRSTMPLVLALLLWMSTSGLVVLQCYCSELLGEVEERLHDTSSSSTSAITPEDGQDEDQDGNSERPILGKCRDIADATKSNSISLRGMYMDSIKGYNAGEASWVELDPRVRDDRRDAGRVAVGVHLQSFLASSPPAIKFGKSHTKGCFAVNRMKSAALGGAGCSSLESPRRGRPGRRRSGGKELARCQAPW